MNNSRSNPVEFTRIGHYDILDCIGRGGMGLVYLARDTRLDRQVAIKCLRTELIEPHYRERFKREALLLAKLNHPHIVQIYDFIETPEQLALVMEFVDGQNLQMRLREHIAPYSQRMRWLTQIAQGLAVAHDSGIIHRDLKAENILINKRNEAKISDLGIAKSQDFNITLTDHVAGSYCSMSPEQAMGEELDFKSDLFSLGILAYQLLCGAHPFGDAANKLQIMQRIISHPPVPPSKHNPSLPPEINALLGQLLSKDPSNRPDNTHWVAAQFDKLSQLVLEMPFISDDTVALSPQQLAINQSSIKNLKIKPSKETQDHPTFDTRFTYVLQRTKIPLREKVKLYLDEHLATVVMSVLALLILGCVTIWQLQPKQRLYIAVSQPTLKATGMGESQQELVKSAVYDAIQQSVIQLDGYYLIPKNEIIDANGDAETVLRATGADELISTDIQCNIEACTITLSRLEHDKIKADDRLRVRQTKTIDVLMDRYSSVAEIVQNNVGSLYSETFINAFHAINEQEYAIFLEANQTLRNKGANMELLNNLDKFQQPTRDLPPVQTLYREIALDIYHETQNTDALTKLENYIGKNSEKNNSVESLNNIYRLQIAQNHLDDAEKTIQKLKALNISHSTINELYAYGHMAKNNYSSAIEFYRKSLDSKITANNLINISNAYWYSGKNELAKKYLTQALSLSPSQHKAHGMYGIIELTEGNVHQAIESFTEVMKIKPDDNTNLNNLGLCHLVLHNYEESIRLFNKALTLAPKNSTYLLNLADAQSLAGQAETARKSYEKIQTILAPDENSRITLRNLAQAYAHLGQYSKALTTLQKLEKIDSQNIETAYTASLVHALAQNNASAILNIENSLQNGMHVIWFRFSWFDSLCKENDFRNLMKKFGEANRCTLQ